MPTLPERLLLVYLQDDGLGRDTKSTLGHALAEAAVTELLPGSWPSETIASAVPRPPPPATRAASAGAARAFATAGSTTSPPAASHQGRRRILRLFTVARHTPVDPIANDRACAAVRAELVDG
jgi:hypothetical protein